MQSGQQRERERRVRETAYFLWEDEGRPEGEAERHWPAAEELVNSEADRENGQTASERRPPRHLQLSVLSA